MSDVTGIYYTVGAAAGSIPNEHSFYTITYANAPPTFIDYGPNMDNYLTGQTYDHSGWSPDSTNTRSLSSVAANEYGDLNSAADALQSYAQNMDENLQNSPIEYGIVFDNSNTATDSLGTAWLGYAPTDAAGNQPIGSDASLMGYCDPGGSGDGTGGKADPEEAIW
jgi:hypothetical protein